MPLLIGNRDGEPPGRGGEGRGGREAYVACVIENGPGCVVRAET